jgi:hypothetical protein
MGYVLDMFWLYIVYKYIYICVIYMGYIWDIHGIYMGYIYGIYIYIDGIYIYGICMGYMYIYMG